MKTFFFFFIFFTLSHAQPSEFIDLPVIDLTSINTVNPDNHHDHDHGAVSTVVDRIAEDENFISDPTTSKLSQVSDNNKPEVSLFDLHYFGKKQRPVRLSIRFPFPRTASRFFPRRCDHNEPDQRFVIPGGEIMDLNMVQFMFKKEMKEKEKEIERAVPRGRNDGPFSDILVPRDVASKDEAKINMMMFGKPHLHFGKTIPRRHRRGRAHHDDEHDRREEQVVFKRGKENIQRDDQKMSERHNDRDDGLKERGQEVLYKIRKFLNYF